MTSETVWRDMAGGRRGLAERVRARDLMVVPGVFDLVSARIADQTGFDALYMSGYGIAASHLGLPDAGLVSYADMLDRTWSMMAVPTPGSDIAEGTAGYPYLQWGRVMVLPEDATVEVGPTLELEPLDGPTARQQWTVLGWVP